jgi:hypothetical protein
VKFAVTEYQRAITLDDRGEPLECLSSAPVHRSSTVAADFEDVASDISATEDRQDTVELDFEEGACSIADDSSELAESDRVFFQFGLNYHPSDSMILRPDFHIEGAEPPILALDSTKSGPVHDMDGLGRHQSPFAPP